MEHFDNFICFLKFLNVLAVFGQFLLHLIHHQVTFTTFDQPEQRFWTSKTLDHPEHQLWKILDFFKFLKISAIFSSFLTKAEGNTFQVLSWPPISANIAILANKVISANYICNQFKQNQFKQFKTSSKRVQNEFNTCLKPVQNQRPC